MEICIVGTEKRTEDDIKLMEAGKKIGKVLYVPITHLALLNNEEGSAVKYRTTKLSKFDALLFRIPKKQYPLAYHIIKNLEKDTAKLQIARSFRISASKISLFHELALKGIKVPRTIFSEDVETIDANLKNLRYPILIKVPTDKKKFMLSNSEQEAKTMIDALKTLQQPLLLEEYYPEADLFKVFVINHEIVCTLKVENPELNYTEGQTKLAKSSRKMIDTALSVSRALNTEIAIISLIDSNDPIVVDVQVCPYIKGADSICGKDIAEIIMNRLKEVTGHSASTGIMSKIVDEFRAAVKEKFS